MHTKSEANSKVKNQVKDRINSQLFTAFLFLYFVTLHADTLAFTLFSSTIRWNNLLALLLFSLLTFRLDRQLVRIDKKISYSLLAISLSMLLSCLFSPFPLRGLSFLGWYGMTLLGYFFLPFLLIHYFEIEKIFRLYFASFFVVGVYAALQFTLSLGGIYDPFATQIFGEKVDLVRANAFCYEPSYYALYMTPFVVMVNLAYLQKRCSIFYMACANLFFLLSTSTSAFFVYFLFFILTYALLFCSKKLRLLFPQLLAQLNRFFLVILTSFSLFFLLAPTFSKLFFLKFFNLHFATHHSFAERWVGILEGWKIFCEKPLLGVGLGAVPPYLMDKYLSGKQTLYGFLDLSSAPNPLKFFEPSNCFMEILSSLGLLGAVAFLALIAGYLSRAKKVLSADNVSGDKKELAYCLLVSMLVMLIVLQFNQGVFRTYVWVHFALSYAFFNKTLKGI